jgi:nickel/cobalt exporter
MSAELWSLAAAALSIGCIHTVLGPDHYVPFVAMSKAGGWSTRKTLAVTGLCALGHVGSSVLLGLVGIAMGLAVNRLEGIEGTRGGIASWLLIGFGLAYLAWGVVQVFRGRPHSHVHAHADGTLHTHPHQHSSSHVHAHSAISAAGSGRMTPWVLFTIFIFGPCEPLIPLLMYPAAEASLWGVALVTVLYSLATLMTMVVMVSLLLRGFHLVNLSSWERYSHVMAGCLVLVCGVAVKFGL